MRHIPLVRTARLAAGALALAGVAGVVGTAHAGQPTRDLGARTGSQTLSWKVGTNAFVHVAANAKVIVQCKVIINDWFPDGARHDYPGYRFVVQGAPQYTALQEPVGSFVLDGGKSASDVASCATPGRTRPPVG